MISVIIPLSAIEESHISLVEELLAHIYIIAEIILVVPSKEKLAVEKKRFSEQVQVLLSPPGRHHQLNAGAERAQSKFLWFLHADSKGQKGLVEKLKKSLLKYPDKLHFFPLRFQDDGPKLMLLNTLGVKLRSEVLELPFGDQGFCLQKKHFHFCGEFNEHPLGEDHHFVWKIKKYGFALNKVDACLYTSARNYRINGWAKTTFKHMRMTTQMAISQLF